MSYAWDEGKKRLVLFLIGGIADPRVCRGEILFSELNVLQCSQVTLLITRDNYNAKLKMVIDPITLLRVNNVEDLQNNSLIVEDTELIMGKIIGDIFRGPIVRRLQYVTVVRLK